MKSKSFLFILSVLLFWSCDNNLKVGIIAPLTGDYSTYGQAMKNGFNLAFENSKFKLIFEDSKFKSTDAINAFNKLVQIDKVEVVYGEASSKVTLSLAPEAQKQKKILFSSISTADDITNSGDFVFRNVPTNYLQGKVAAEYLIKKLKCKKIGILKDNDDYGNSLAKSFIEFSNKLGGKIVREDSYFKGNKDFKPQLMKLKSSNIDGLFIPGNYNETAIILKQMKELNIAIPIIGGDGSYSQDLITNAGNASEGFYLTHFKINEKSDFYISFKKKFIAKYNREPDVYESYAYEAGFILRTALESEGNNSEKIKEYLYKTTFNSLTGPLKFDSNGDVIRDFGVLRVKQGKFINQN
jgi:branched-chain amino acid transport system substrate-binding protein